MQRHLGYVVLPVVRKLFENQMNLHHHERKHKFLHGIRSPVVKHEGERQSQASDLDVFDCQDEILVPTSLGFCAHIFVTSRRICCCSPTANEFGLSSDLRGIDHA